MSQRVRPLFSNLQYCVRCCMPETQEGIQFDEMGICQACQSSEQKIHINWVERKQGLNKILETAKANAKNNYDCLVPISGGKDSAYQLHVLVKEYGMRPLAVTFNHNWFSETGLYNLLNILERLDVDHVMFTPKRSLVNRLAKKSLSGIGDACWSCHSGVGAFPLQAAVHFKVPLLIWGESIAEASARASYYEPVRKFDREYFTKVSAKLEPSEMVCEYLTERELNPFRVPSVEECEEVGVFGIHLGDYMFWDTHLQVEFVRATYGWRETTMDGTYKGYKSVECIMAAIHDFTCYLKRGYGRTSFQASIDVRNGLLTREEGFVLVNKYDPLRPRVLDYYLKITGMSEKEFYEIMEKQRMPQLKGIEIPVHQNNEPHEERLLPIAEQYVEKGKVINSTHSEIM